MDRKIFREDGIYRGKRSAGARWICWAGIVWIVWWLGTKQAWPLSCGTNSFVQCNFSPFTETEFVASNAHFFCEWVGSCPTDPGSIALKLELKDLDGEPVASSTSWRCRVGGALVEVAPERPLRAGSKYALSWDSVPSRFRAEDPEREANVLAKVQALDVIDTKPPRFRGVKSASLEDIPSDWGKIRGLNIRFDAAWDAFVHPDGILYDIWLGTTSEELEASTPVIRTFASGFVVGSAETLVFLGENICTANFQIDPLQDYFVRVRAVDASGNSTFGAKIVQATPLPREGGGCVQVLSSKRGHGNLAAAGAVVPFLGLFALFRARRDRRRVCSRPLRG